MESGQKGWIRVKKAWENGKKHSGMLKEVIHNHFIWIEAPTVCNALCQNGKLVFPDGLSLLSLLKLTLSLWHFWKRALSLIFIFLKFSISSLSLFLSFCFKRLFWENENCLRWWHVCFLSSIFDVVVTPPDFCQISVSSWIHFSPYFISGRTTALLFA